MKSFLKKVSENIWQGYNLFGWLLIAIIFLSEGFRTKNMLMKAGVNFNNWDIFLSLLTDPYLLLFFIIPLSLYWSVTVISQDLNYQFLARWRSYRRWMIASLRHYWQYMGILLVIWILSAGYLLIGVSFSSNWSNFSKESSALNTLGPLTNYLTPLGSTLLQIGMFILTTSILHLLMLCCRVWTNRMITLSISVLVFVWGIVAFKFLPVKNSFLAPTTYLSISQNISFWHQYWWEVMLIEAVVLLLIILTFKLPGLKRLIIACVGRYWVALLYFLIGFLGVLSVILFHGSNAAGSTFEKMLVYVFAGNNANFMNYSNFLRYSVLTLGILYFIQLKLSSEFSDFRFFKLIRYENVYRWLIDLFVRIIAKIFCVLTVWLLVVLVVSELAGYPLGITKEFSIILCHYLINGTLQLSFYSLAIFIIFWNSRQITNQGIIFISCLLVLMLPHINSTHLLPVGLSAMNYLEVMSVKEAFIILLCSNALAVGLIYHQVKN